MTREVCQNLSRANTINLRENRELTVVKSTAAQDNVVTLGLLRFHGPDATAFLQGQLSNDVEALEVGVTQLAGYHNPQGRVIALLRLARVAPTEVLALLPQDLAATVAQRLRRYVLRSKLTLDLLDAPAIAAATATLPAGMATTRSRPADIAAGLPQVYAATSEQFVAQMLNLDCIGAVSFGKGCYTGQEVIARAHYRGRVKRRMQRFVTMAAVADACAAPPLVPGAGVRLPDGRRLDIVDAAARADGRVEFLAVAPLETTAPSESAAATAAAEPSTAGVDAPPLLDCAPLPLPYALPD
jgi:folate-binding protein YgfZ